MGLDRGIQWLIDIMRNCVEGGAESRHTVVWIQRIGIQCVPNTKRPGKLRSHFPSVLRIEIKVEEVEWLICSKGESLRRGRGHSVDKLWQGGVGHRGDRRS